ncbi:hypothetical protein FRC15_006932 [Serendipita sp. 397]|nr:hypothetical protein FRC15_006932 [Serendipita sp. 397]
MSNRRPEYQTKFSSKGAFDGLPVDDIPSEEEEEEDAPVIVEPDAPVVPTPAPAPVVEAPKQPTKTQQKKAAKATKQQKVPPPISTASNEPLVASTSSLNPDEQSRQVPAMPSLGTGESTPLPQPFPLRAMSRSPRGSISSPADPPFTPNLPAVMPRPSRGSITRKRKASTDLSSTNPKESKVEIELENKFEGNGKEGKGTSIPLTIDVSSSVVVDVNAEAEKVAKKRKDTGNRIMSGLVLAAGFLGLLLAGHMYMIILIILIQSIVFREITQLFQGTRDPWSKTLNWYFFAIANYYLYGETIIYYFKHVILSEAVFHPFVANHRFISFMLYIFGFMGFVASLKRNYLQRQFSLFGWVHMTLLVIVVSSHFIVDNILEGMIWFWLPASLVICNDVFAWFWGVTLGRTQLFALSPKKTVEGFVGAFFSTVILGFFWASFFMRYDYMICPVTDLGDSAFSGLTCKPNPVFVWRDYELAKPAAAVASFLVGLFLLVSAPCPSGAAFVSACLLF